MNSSLPDKSTPAGAQLVGGVWLPATERHFVGMMKDNKKNHRVVDGKLTYQYRKLEAAMKEIPANRRRGCLDIGAHVGLWAMWLVKEFEHVHCFEPMQAFADILPFNMPAENYTLHNTALGKVTGTAQLLVPQGVTGNAHIVTGGKAPTPEYASQPQFEVQVVPLDAMHFEQPIDFIKIDVEGYELQVVEGAEQTLRTHKPFIVIEQKGNDNKFFGQPKEAALNYLRKLGMRHRWDIGGDWFLGW